MESIDVSCREFVSRLSSSSPTPGGGGASALAGAMGAALGLMVGNLTVGKEKYAAVEADIRELNDSADSLERRLLKLVDEDARAFAPLAAAYSMPKGPERDAVMAAALEAACQTPLEIMEAACVVINLHRDYVERGAAIAISDVGVGVAMCRAALDGAYLNVLINTKSMKDRQLAKSINQRAEEMHRLHSLRAYEVYADVMERLE